LQRLIACRRLQQGLAWTVRVSRRSGGASADSRPAVIPTYNISVRPSSRCDDHVRRRPRHRWGFPFPPLCCRTGET
jgi:hypothetical protein